MASTGWGTLGQISRPVADIAAAGRFWRDVMELPHLYTFGSLAFFDCSGTRLMLSAGPEAGKEASILYFLVDDIVDRYRELGERGAAQLATPHVIHTHSDGTEEWMAFVADNEGRPLGLMCRRPPLVVSGGG